MNQRPPLALISSLGFWLETTSPVKETAIRDTTLALSTTLESSPTMTSSPLAWKPFPSLLSFSWNSHGLRHDLQPRSKEQGRLPAPITSLIFYWWSSRSFPSSGFSWCLLWYSDCHWLRPLWKRRARTPHRHHAGPRDRPLE